MRCSDVLNNVVYGACYRCHTVAWSARMNNPYFNPFWGRELESKDTDLELEKWGISVPTGWPYFTYHWDHRPHTITQAKRKKKLGKLADLVVRHVEDQRDSDSPLSFIFPISHPRPSRWVLRANSALQMASVILTQGQRTPKSFASCGKAPPDKIAGIYL